jgi:hypothetical protein
MTQADALQTGAPQRTAKGTCNATTVLVTRSWFPYNPHRPRDFSADNRDNAAQVAPYLQYGLPRSPARSALSLAIGLHAIELPAGATLG